MSVVIQAPIMRNPATQRPSSMPDACRRLVTVSHSAASAAMSPATSKVVSSAEAEDPEDQRGRDEPQHEERDARERAGAAPAAGTLGHDGARNRSAELGRHLEPAFLVGRRTPAAPHGPGSRRRRRNCHSVAAATHTTISTKPNDAVMPCRRGTATAQMPIAA